MSFVTHKNPGKKSFFVDGAWDMTCFYCVPSYQLCECATASTKGPLGTWFMDFVWPNSRAAR